MADIADVNVDNAHNSLPNFNINSDVSCVNCIQMKSQLDDAISELK
jgi:hypothetical protein